MCTKDDERTFALKIQELSEIKPSLIGLSKFFTLDESSDIKQFFNKQFGHLLYEESDMIGDVGGSSVKVRKLSQRMSEIVGSHTSSYNNKTVEVITEANEDDEEESKHDGQGGATKKINGLTTPNELLKEIEFRIKEMPY